MKARAALRATALLVAVALAASCTSGGDGDSGGREDRGATEAPTCPDLALLGCPLRAAAASVPVVGTTLTLEYRSDRAPGRTVAPRWDARAVALGGWTLDVQHAYDPDAAVLHTGDGGVRAVDAVAADDVLLVASADGGELYEFAEDGRHTATVDPLTGAVLQRLTYDEDDRLQSVTSRHGLATTIERGEEGQPVALVSPGGLRTELTVDGDGFLTSVLDPIGARSTMQYAPGGLLTSVTDGAGRSRTFTYDDEGRVETSVDPAGRTITYAGADSGNSVDISITAANDRTQRWQVQRTDDGARIVLTDGGRTWEEQITGDDHVVVAPDGTRTEAHFTADPRFGRHAPLVERLVVQTPSGVDRETTSAIDAKLDDPADPRTLTSFVVTETTGSATATSAWDRPTSTLTLTDGAGIKRATRFDQRGDVVAVDAPGIAPFTIDYDDRGRPTAFLSGERRTTLAWDDAGGEVAITDPLGGVTRVTADAAGRPSALIRPDGTRITIDRSAAGDLVATRVDGVQVLSQSWSPSGDLLSSAFGTGLEFDAWEFGADGLTSVVHRPDGDIVPRYEAGELVGLELPDGTLSVERDPATGVATRIEDTITGLATEALVEDGAVVGLRRKGPVEADVRWDLDDAGRVIGLSVEAAGDKETVDYRYDDAGRLVGAGDLTIGYDEEGRPATSTVGVVRSERDYDDQGQLTAERYVADAGPVYEATYGYDLLGRMSTRSTSDAGATPATTTYAYDAGGRLVSAAIDGTPAYSYAYDGLDRLTSVTTPTGTEALTYGTDGRVATRGDVAYAWSATGTLKSLTTPSGTTTLETDLLGRLQSARSPDGSSTGYVLDEDGNIAERDKDGVSQRFVYDDAGRLVAELGPDGRIVRRYVYEDGPFAALVITDQGTFRIIRDAAGNPIGAIDVATGKRVQTIDYDPMGRSTRTGEPVVPFDYLDGFPDLTTGTLLPTRGPSHDPGAGGPITGAPVWNPARAQPTAPGGSGAVAPADGGGGGGGGGGGAGGGLLGPGLSISPFSHGGGGGVATGTGTLSGGGLGGGGALGGGLGILGGVGGIVRDLFVSGDYRGLLFEGLGQGLQALGGVALGIGGKLAGAGSGLTSGVSGYFAGRDLVSDVPQIFLPGTSKADRLGLAIKSVGSLAAFIASSGGLLLTLADAFGLAGGIVLLPIIFEGLAIAAVVVGAIYLVYEIGRAAGWWGDPHLTTVDDLNYDFQAVGEFVASRATDGGFEVQVRSSAFGEGRRVSLATAVAARIGGARVTIALGTDVPLRVDGVPVDLPVGGVDLPGGGRVDHTVDGRYVLVDADRTVGVVVRNNTNHLAVDLLVAERYEGQLVGLAGDADGNPDGDLRARDGTVVEPERGDFTLPIYAVFGESWRVSPAESLFDYEPGTSTETYTDRQYPAAPASAESVDAVARARAEKVCGGAGLDDAFLEACILDVGLTGDTGFVSSSVAAAAAQAQARAGRGAPGSRGAGQDEVVKIGDTFEGTLAGEEAVDHYRFTGDKGDVLLLVPDDDTPCVDVRVTILDGGVDGGACDGVRFELPRGGEYKMDVRVNNGGRYGFELRRAPSPEESSIDVGDDVSGQFDDPGERHEYRFDADPGTAVFVGGEAPDCNVQLQVFGRGDEPLARGSACLGIGRVLLADGGEYRVLASAPVTYRGSYKLSVVQSSVDERFEISVGDEIGPGRPGAGAGVIDRPGAVDIYVFQGRAGERVVIRGAQAPVCFGLRPWTVDGYLEGLVSTCGEWAFTVVKDGPVEIQVGGGEPRVGEYSFRLEAA